MDARRSGLDPASLVTMPPERGPYDSERQGREPQVESLDFETLRRLVVNVFDSFRERAYFQEAFGYDCVDGDRVGTLGSDPDAFFLRTIGREHIWPYWHVDPTRPSLLRSTWAEEWDVDTLFDVVEVLHDHVSKPTAGRYHSFTNCGYHASHFDGRAGQREYREEMNRVLGRHDPPYEFGPDGRLIERAPDEFKGLLDAEVPDGTEHDLITEKVEDATRLFLARSSSVSDRKHAVRALAEAEISAIRMPIVQ